MLFGGDYPSICNEHFNTLFIVVFSFFSDFGYCAGGPDRLDRSGNDFPRRSQRLGLRSQTSLDWTKSTRNLQDRDKATGDKRQISEDGRVA